MPSSSKMSASDAAGDECQLSRQSTRTNSASGSSVSNEPLSILVGYAFGHKKMSTMGIIMAEASKASRYFTQHMFTMPATTMNSAGQYASGSTVVTQESTPMEQQQDGINRFMPLSCETVSMLSRSSGQASHRTKNVVWSSNQSTSGASCASSLSSVTGIMHGASSFISRNPIIRVSFVPVDLDSPLEEQHGGNFDVILHKLTEDILTISSNPDAKTEEVARATGRVENLKRYMKRYNPSCSLVDHPDKIKTLMSREDIAVVLSNCLVGVTSKSGVPVRAPRFLVYPEELKGRGTESDIADRIFTAPFTFPLIAKPLTAAGTVESHKLGIVLGKGGLKKLQKPCIVQEYANHDAALFKVYVLGEEVFVYRRPSLPNLPTGESSSRVYGDLVEFDSQRPYPKLSDFGEFSPSSRKTTVAAEKWGSTWKMDPHHCRKRRKVENVNYASTAMLAATFMTEEEIRPVVSVLRKAFGLELFGFDVLVTRARQTMVHTENEKEILVVDVNYFPSYKEVSNFPTLLAKYLTQRAIAGKEESWRVR
mmetsp:Transcript_14568/g.22463  ORF Transcript_14568/g.22463 Transcript_14568/m.22463 type:complete len:538 (-) Transcript_14568:235-1848(-)